MFRNSRQLHGNTVLGTGRLAYEEYLLYVVAHIPSLTVGVLLNTHFMAKQNPDRQGGDMSDKPRKLLITRSEH